MKGHRVEGLRARHERGAAESAQLRQHRASRRRTLSFRTDRRRRARRPRADDGRRPAGDRASPGYSLGGNLALKLAGEYGAHPPRALVAVAAVSPIIEIGECTRALERRENVLYQWNFVKDLKRRMRRKEQYRPGRFDLSAAGRDQHRPRVRRGLHGAAFRVPQRRGLLLSRQRHAGRRPHPGPDADHHVRRRSVRAVAAVSRLRGSRRTPASTCTCRTHGGHCGFVGARSGADDGYWAENQIVQFVAKFGGLNGSG